ncbi:A1AO ATPase, subunit F [Methanobrevibacter arboriphilus JCM 13429 = DSM 1125]|jgi:V/A-type H+-transporting ATPase subunit F|uniref:A-type ATP synthase subunit F n=2 Tax=Methanobrevibacter arboriphilus TaxID=39441 RepID=A0A1V6N185_METAZ|nr:V-type ATP synthase subunit F [Methanobrevibacter arboriphilus]MCC7561851.1 V-type ATP synthase subunit F [Methanobrevibacter arboriphilus]OQD58459.1 A1AO ATPase, subunit F [Methanobrevibacter arboriphilus JCM 13429 = DSM 1125]BBL62752.1 ATP synthase subunit F [Methanobrevibacter arboriphilus]GLI11992.1 ATP synthase subunit F [Methanobrevibacter arboriphilus]
MKSSVAIIGDLDTVTGFQLGGVKVSKVVETNEDAENALDELINDEVSIIIITENIADNIRKYMEKKIGSNVLPMIIEIPDKSGPSDRESDPMGELIKRVIGVEMVK